METLTTTLWTALVLYLLYKTDAVYSYLGSSLLSWLNPITKVKKYKEVMQHGMTYSEFMSTYHNNLLVKLLSCRYCFGLWLALGMCSLTGSVEALPIAYFGGQTICTLFDWLERKMNDE